MGMFKRKKKADGNDGNDNDSEFANLETGEAETDDLLARLQSGVGSVQQQRQQEAAQKEAERERAQAQQERERPRSRGCGFCG